MKGQDSHYFGGSKSQDPKLVNSWSEHPRNGEPSQDSQAELGADGKVKGSIRFTRGLHGVPS